MNENKSLTKKEPSQEEIAKLILSFDCRIFNVKILTAIPFKTIFFRAELPNSIFGINSMICEPGRQLRIVAYKSGVNQWMMAAGPADWSWEKVRDWGNKLHSDFEIRRTLPCDDEVLKLYNH